MRRDFIFQNILLIKKHNSSVVNTSVWIMWNNDITTDDLSVVRVGDFLVTFIRTVFVFNILQFFFSSKVESPFIVVNLTLFFVDNKT